MPMRQAGMFASRSPTWLRDHFWRRTIAPFRSFHVVGLDRKGAIVHLRVRGGHFSGASAGALQGDIWAFRMVPERIRSGLWAAARVQALEADPDVFPVSCAVVRSKPNPAPATNTIRNVKTAKGALRDAFCVQSPSRCLT
jgi:hypothetical protein